MEWWTWILVLLGFAALVVTVMVADRSDWFQRLTAKKAEEQRDKQTDVLRSIDGKLSPRSLDQTATAEEPEPEPAPEPMSAAARRDQEQAQLATKIAEIAASLPFEFDPSLTDGGYFLGPFRYRPPHRLDAYDIQGEFSPDMYSMPPVDFTQPRSWRMESGSGRNLRINPVDHATPIPDHIYIDIRYRVEGDESGTVHCQRLSLWLSGDEPPIDFGSRCPDNDE